MLKVGATEACEGSALELWDEITMNGFVVLWTSRLCRMLHCPSLATRRGS